MMSYFTGKQDSDFGLGKNSEKIWNNAGFSSLPWSRLTAYQHSYFMCNYIISLYTVHILSPGYLTFLILNIIIIITFINN